jgi:hypothetical protein
MIDERSGSVRRRLTPGEYASVDVSQTKEKGLAICLLSVPADGKISIRYYHQPFLSSKPTRKEVEKMIAAWPSKLNDDCCYSVDSPLEYAKEEGGRKIDRKPVWERLGFGAYLNNNPQQAPTEAKASADDKLWIKIGKWLKEALTDGGKTVFEVYPTPSLNALHIWQAGGIRVSDWFDVEPDEYMVITEKGTDALPLRFLERLKTCDAYGGMRTRFRKLSVWPYPDLWDALGGAVTSALFASDLTERISDDPDEGQIVVPMRLDKLLLMLE